MAWHFSILPELSIKFFHVPVLLTHKLTHLSNQYATGSYVHDMSCRGLSSTPVWLVWLMPSLHVSPPCLWLVYSGGGSPPQMHFVSHACSSGICLNPSPNGLMPSRYKVATDWGSSWVMLPCQRSCLLCSRHSTQISYVIQLPRSSSLLFWRWLECPS